MKRLIIAILLLSPTLLSAQTEGWLPPPPPTDVCEQVEKNVRAIYLSWASGATQTFADLRQQMRAALTGKGDQEQQLKTIYEKVFERVGANEFSQPNFDNRVAGHLAAKKFAVDRCKEQIRSER